MISSRCRLAPAFICIAPEFLRPAISALNRSENNAIGWCGQRARNTLYRFGALPRPIASTQKNGGAAASPCVCFPVVGGFASRAKELRSDADSECCNPRQKDSRAATMPLTWGVRQGLKPEGAETQARRAARKPDRRSRDAKEVLKKKQVCKKKRRIAPPQSPATWRAPGNRLDDLRHAHRRAGGSGQLGSFRLYVNRNGWVEVDAGEGYPKLEATSRKFSDNSNF